MKDPGGAPENGARAGLVLGGRYRLLAPIGTGGMAVVWQAHDSVLARSVAVKMVKPGQAADVRSRERIRLEARAAGGLSHPNIAHVHDYGEVEIAGQVLPYVVMELVTGGTLLQRLSAGPVVAGFAMRVGAEIAAALAAAHAEGLVHRDIKPGNVILSPTGAKVVDFGIAAAARAEWPAPRVAGDEADDGALGELLGTPAYLAPERLVGDAVVPASDVYALGVVLYLMLSGRSPWNSENTRQMLEAHLYVPPLPLPPVDGVPDRVVDLCNRCLAKDPDERPSAEEVAEVLSQSAGLRPLPEDRPVFPINPVGPIDAVNAVGLADSAHSLKPFKAVVEPGEDGLAGPPAPASQAEKPEPRDRSRVTRWAAAAALLIAAGAGGWLFLREDGADGGAGTVVAAESADAAQPSAVNPGSSRAPRATATGTRTISTREVTPGAGTPQPPPPAGVAPTVTAPPTALPTATTTTAPTPTVEVTTTTTTTAAPVQRTLSSAGGTVVATCHPGGDAEILSWKAAGSYKVQSTDPGPSAAPSVTFKHGNRRVTMTVSCDSGAPTLA
ncbi:serine/threonine protein kinase [Actinoplanes hulinensis]|uniref:non-specific serine/threonine protein kinase n=1 Tax=Actinoplanes hulinensis TaxID=1144547 RepID=A0ABS7B5R8_9ACTN|nr:serine/threonine-protein kinase [Actinoplanes hulinensis]MBW6435623.1 serine/threonine protein kinase [Actinoplanes hulinensis]